VGVGYTGQGLQGGVRSWRGCSRRTTSLQGGPGRGKGDTWQEDSPQHPPYSAAPGSQACRSPGEGSAGRQSQPAGACARGGRGGSGGGSGIKSGVGGREQVPGLTRVTTRPGRTPGRRRGRSRGVDRGRRVRKGTGLRRRLWGEGGGGISSSNRGTGAGGARGCSRAPEKEAGPRPVAERGVAHQRRSAGEQGQGGGQQGRAGRGPEFRSLPGRQRARCTAGCLGEGPCG